MKTKSRPAVILLLLMAISLISCTQESKIDNSYVSKIQSERNETNSKFKKTEETILPAEDIKTFTGLEYFNIKPEYNIRAKYELIKDGDIFEMKTSTTRLPEYKKFAKLTFEIDGKEFRLFAYENQKTEINDEYKDHLFVPFTDLTNGESTYGGGRYIDIKKTDSDEVELDFNTCYNPYCAYNHKYSCPIPPLENHLEIEILAGVKDYTNNAKHAKH